MENQNRTPAVAGLFYPAEKSVCEHEVTDLLDRNHADLVTGMPKALIVPHAGYIYSGPVAAQAYNLIAPFKDEIRSVVLLGPSHRVPLRGMALSSAQAFVTPLGDIPLDVDFIGRLAEMPDVTVMDLAHQYEHSLEVQLPFLQKVLNDFTLIPIVVGECEPESVANVLELVWNKPDVLIVVSSDLSHFLDYEMACVKDRRTSQAIERGQYYLTGDQACGCYAINGLLLEARRSNNKIECVALANSGDTAGDTDRVVGYGAYAIQ